MHPHKTSFVAVPARNSGCFCFPSEINCKDIAQALTRKCARLHFAALAALNSSCADLTVFRQSFLCEAFLLPEFGNLQSEIRLVYESLLW